LSQLSIFAEGNKEKLTIASGALLRGVTTPTLTVIREDGKMMDINGHCQSPVYLLGVEDATAATFGLTENIVRAAECAS
jgi:hypothetical protein